MPRGKSRILVGPDAYLADALTRLTATGYEQLLYRRCPASWPVASDRRW